MLFFCNDLKKKMQGKKQLYTTYLALKKRLDKGLFYQ